MSKKISPDGLASITFLMLISLLLFCTVKVDSPYKPKPDIIMAITARAVIMAILRLIVRFRHDYPLKGNFLIHKAIKKPPDFSGGLVLRAWSQTNLFYNNQYIQPYPHLRKSSDDSTWFGYLLSLCLCI